MFETIKAAMLSWRSYSEYKTKYSSITSSDLDVNEAAQRHSYLFLWDVSGFGRFTAASGALRWRKRRLRDGATSVRSLRLSSSGPGVGDSEKSMESGEWKTVVKQNESNLTILMIIFVQYGHHLLINQGASLNKTLSHIQQLFTSMCFLKKRFIINPSSLDFCIYYVHLIAPPAKAMMQSLFVFVFTVSRSVDVICKLMVWVTTKYRMKDWKKCRTGGFCY